MSDTSTKTTAIAEYSQTEAALAELRTRFTDVKYDVSTTKGIDEAKKARAEIKKYRVALEDKRKEIKEPALRHCQLIDAEAKRITEELRKLEDPIDKQIKDEEARKEAEKQAKAKAERERVTAIQSRIASFNRYPVDAVAMTSTEIKELVEIVQMIVIDDTFAEFKDQATADKSATIAKLTELANLKEQQEAQAEQIRLQQEELKAQQAIQDQADREAKEAIAAEQNKLAEDRAELERKQQAVNAAAAALPSVRTELLQDQQEQQQSTVVATESAPQAIHHHVQAVASIHRLASDLSISDKEVRKKILEITSLFN